MTRRTARKIAPAIAPGTDVSIFLDGAIAHSAVGVTMAHTRCVLETEKAVQLEAVSPKGKLISAWFPRKAIVATVHQHVIPGGGGALTPEYVHYELARWFRPLGWTATFLDLATTSSTLAA